MLAVDADPESRESIQSLMQDAGIRLDTAAGWEEAAAWLRDNGKDCQIVLLDWETCGLQAARDLRESFPMPILFLAESGAEGLEEALQIKSTGILTKPFFVSAFREKVAQLWADPGEAPAPAEDSGLRGFHFLAAEDNEINAEILTELLEIEGASCEIVENGRLAVERFQEAEAGAFDAILMDVQMPVMNGHEAARAIRSLEREDAGRIPIIAMTANAFAEDEKAALDAGMTAHVAKPLNMEHLKSVIAQCTKRKEDGS